ncbi:hypothetical protein Glove_606g68 [Diversispora epigaea]|uniref:Uncharacterized protein n=1 Tax=Diversispora epigaea TaxID=1348612 RepID=A0A397GB24_9GLOM|nr:hypothetical protein Glove_606g68 [Diversispora epigaea]
MLDFSHGTILKCILTLDQPVNYGANNRVADDFELEELANEIVTLLIETKASWLGNEDFKSICMPASFIYLTVGANGVPDDFLSIYTIEELAPALEFHREKNDTKEQLDKIKIIGREMITEISEDYTRSV